MKSQSFTFSVQILILSGFWGEMLMSRLLINAVFLQALRLCIILFEDFQIYSNKSEDPQRLTPFY